MPTQIFDEFLTKKKSSSTNLIVLGSATVNVYSPGATANGAGSGTSITVFDSSAFSASDTIEINGNTATVTSVPDGTTIVHDNASASWGDLDRVLLTSSPLTVYEDEGASSAITQPITAGSDGRVKFYMATSDTADLRALDSDSAILIKPDIGRIQGGDRVWNVADYGGKTDTSISAAIAAAAAAGGGKVVLEEGNYALAAPIDMLPAVWLAGKGMGVTNLVLDAAVNDSCLTYVSATPGTWCKITDCTFDGNDSNQSTGSGAAINLRNIDHIIIRDVEAKNCRGQGIIVNANDTTINRVLIEDNYVHDCCSSSTAGLPSIHLIAGSGQEVQDAFIKNNWVDKSGDGNSSGTLTGHGIGFSGNGTVRRFMVIDNFVTNSFQNGILVLTNPEEQHILGNYVYNSGLTNAANGGNGIFLSQSGRAIIKGNTVDTVAENSDNGIETVGDSGVTNADVLIEGNRIKTINNASKAAIFVGTVNRVSVKSNVIVNASGEGQGIDVQNNSSGPSDLTSMSIDANNIEVSGTLGIRVRGWSNITVNNNTVKGASRGIAVELMNSTPPDDLTVCNNVVTDSSTDDGIRLIASGSSITGAVVSNNVCRRNTQNGMTLSNLVGAVVSGNNCSDNEQPGIELLDCSDIVFTANLLKANNTDGTAAEVEALQLRGTCDNIQIEGNAFIDNVGSGANGVAIGGYSGATLTNIAIGDNLFNGNTTDVEDNLGELSVASATTITVPPGPKDVTVLLTGTATVNTINGGWAGRRVTFIATGALTIADGAGNISLNASSGNFGGPAGVGDTLTLVYQSNGDEWWEVARSDNS